MSRVTPPLLLLAGSLALFVASAAGAYEAASEDDAASQASLDDFFARRAAELDAWIPARMEALTDEALNTDLAALAAVSERRLARAIALQTETQLAMRMQESRRVAMGEHPAKPQDEAGGRMASGSLAVPRGASTGRHRFPEPFADTPNIALSVRPDSGSRAGRPSATLRILSVDATGFEYEVRSAGDEPIEELTADWVAYSADSDATPAAIR